MTSTKPQPTGPGTQLKEWDEPRLQTGLARIQELHINLRQLRDTVPSLLRPIHAEHTSPETLYAEFRTAAARAVASVEGFKRMMREGRSREALARARASKDENDEGVESWLVSQHADWLERPVVRGGKDVVKEEVEGGEWRAEKVGEVVGRFKERWPGLEVTLKEERQNIAIVLPAPAKLQFAVSWEAGQEHPTYKASTKGPSKMHNCINQALEKRVRADELDFTLQMLACYSDIRTRRCDKCNKLMSLANEFAVIREGKQSTAEKPKPSITWRAYHPGCS